MATVKDLGNDTWEVSLGAGVLPRTVTLHDIFMYELMSGSTVVGPMGQGTNEVLDFMDCIVAVKKHLDAQGKEVRYAVVPKR